MKYLILFVTLSLPFISQGQEDRAGENYWAHRAYNLNSIALWKKYIAQLDSDLAQKPDDPKTLLDIAYAYYGLSGTCISLQDKKNGADATKNGIEVAKKLLDNSTYASQANALLSGLYGIQIAFNPMRGMSLGPKSNALCEKALELDSLDAFAYLQKGSSLYNTPKMFGGNAEKSIDYFKKAISLYEQSDNPDSVWKLESMTWLGQAYSKTGNKMLALQTYEEILSIAPENQWAQYLKDKL